LVQIYGAVKDQKKASHEDMWAKWSVGAGQQQERAEWLQGIRVYGRFHNPVELLD
jgi:hypothetical protein